MSKEGSLGEGTIERMARLAKLLLTNEEKEMFEPQLAQILSYFDSIQATVDALGSDWRSDIIGAPVNERPDQNIPFANLQNALNQAPARAGSSFQVPKIID